MSLGDGDLVLAVLPSPCLWSVCLQRWNETDVQWGGPVCSLQSLTGLITADSETELCTHWDSAQPDTRTPEPTSRDRTGFRPLMLGSVSLADLTLIVTGVGGKDGCWHCSLV